MRPGSSESAVKLAPGSTINQDVLDACVARAMYLDLPKPYNMLGLWTQDGQKLKLGGPLEAPNSEETAWIIMTKAERANAFSVTLKVNVRPPPSSAKGKGKGEANTAVDSKDLICELIKTHTIDVREILNLVSSPRQVESIELRHPKRGYIALWTPKGTSPPKGTPPPTGTPPGTGTPPPAGTPPGTDYHFTHTAFVPGSIHEILVKCADCPDVSISFSTNCPSEAQVCADFGLTKASSSLALTGGSLDDIPDDQVFIVEYVLQLYLDILNLEYEVERRKFVSFLMAMAMRMATGTSHRLHAEVKSQFMGVRQNTGELVKYSGLIDYIFANKNRTVLDSKGEGLDTSVVVIEVKTVNTLLNTVPQALAELCSTMAFRKAHGRGRDGSGLPLHLVHSDGFRWDFYKLDKVGDDLMYWKGGLGGDPLVVNTGRIDVDNCPIYELKTAQIKPLLQWLVALAKGAVIASPITGTFPGTPVGSAAARAMILTDARLSIEPPPTPAVEHGNDEHDESMGEDDDDESTEEDSVDEYME
jgi:hypothetical protein